LARAVIVREQEEARAAAVSRYGWSGSMRAVYRRLGKRRFLLPRCGG
jgi:hypothetical protein